MRKNVIWTACIICISFSFSCNSNENNNEEAPDEVTQDTLSGSSSVDSAITITNRPLIWTVNQDSGMEKLKKPKEVRLDTFSSGDLIRMINNSYPDIHLDLVKISHDTIYVNIPDSKKLTQEMGSTGSENYMASATYTLTELKNVQFVHFAMKPGDHAEPGVFSRDDFKRLR